MTGKTIVFFCVILFLSFDLVGQTKNEERFGRLEYANAIKGYEKIIEKNPTDLDARHRLAFAYHKTGQMDQSYQQYRYLVIADYKKMQPTDWNNYAHLCLAYGAVLDATRAFNKLSAYNSKATIQKKPSNPNYFSATNVSYLNTSFSEFSPTLYNNQLVFSSDRPVSLYDLNQSDWSGTAYLSVFSSDTNKNSTPTLFSKKLNESYHIGPISFSADGNVAYITKSFKEDKNSLNQTQIYIADKKKGKWSTLVPFEFASDKDHSFAHPVFIPGLNLLVFSSNMPGGFGEMDLYYCKFENNTWSKPINFGEKINTPFNDVFPCYNPYRPNCLYFSSNGYIGFGGLDIFEINYSSGNWTSPTLLPKAINSNFDDFGICFSSDKSGYVTSNRLGGIGKDDIYLFNQIETTTIEGVLVDGIKYEPLPNKKLYLVDDNKTIFDSVVTDKNGYFVYTKLPYQNVSLMPLNESDSEMIIRPLKDDCLRDPFVNIKLLTSNKVLLDSIGLVQTELVTYVLESADQLKKRCVVYENGDKAVLVIVNVKDKNGQTIDQLTTDQSGCFTIKKLYSEGSYLELLEEMKNELQMRFVNEKDEKNTNWQNEKTPLEITTMKRCVVYENGEEAVQINFAVKDSTGAIIDLITTDEDGCFKIRKLYNQKTYLDLLEDEMAEIGLRFKNQKDENNFLWYKDEEKIVLVSGTICVEYSDGSKAVTVKFEVKDSLGTTYDYVTTDDNGCFKIRKMYSDKSYLELLVEQDVFLRSNSFNTQSNDVVVLTQHTTLTTEQLTGKLYDYKKLDKDFTGINIVFFSESGMVMNTSKVSKNGEFSYSKLPTKKGVLMMIQDNDGVLQGSKSITVKGQVTGVNKFINVDNTSFYIVDANNEKFLASKLSSKGNFQFEIKLENYELVPRVKETPTFEEIKPSSENKVVSKNIYFESKKWELDAEGKKVLDELTILLKANPNLSLNIYAYTDSRGKTSDNLELSNNRAESVSIYLKSKGVSSKQFITKGCGESKLINHCANLVECSDEEHAKNRRIEFEFIWK